MLEKAFATISGFASNSFRSEFSDWSRLAEWTKRNPARWIYGIAGLWFSLYVLLSHESNAAEFIAEYGQFRIGDDVYNLLVTIWLVSCMFSFFSERTLAKWLRGSLVIFAGSAELLNLWDIGAVGIVWLPIVWVLFTFIEGAVCALDEASRRIRLLKYVLFTIALCASYTSVGIVFLLNVENPLWYMPLFLTLWAGTAVWMLGAYRDRSDLEGATFHTKVGLTKFIIATFIAVVLSGIIEIAFGIPVEIGSRALWIEENLNLSTHWAGFINGVTMCGLFGVGAAMTWLGANAPSRIASWKTRPWSTGTLGE